MSARSQSRRKCDGFLIAITPGHHGPRHSCELVGERDRSDLGGPPRQQSCEPGPMFSAVDFGIADHRQRARREQAAQIAIALFADTAELVLAPARVLLWHEPDPRREIPTRSKSLRISNAGDQSGGQRGTHAGNLIQSLARLIGSMTGNNLTVEVEDLRFQRPQLGAESKEAGPGNLRQPLVAYIGDHIEQLFNAITSDRCDNAKLSKMGTDRIDHRRLLANEQMACAMEHQAALLLPRLGRHEPHVWPGDRLADGLSIGGIILLSLDVRLDVGRRHQAHRMTKTLQFARPMMR